MKSCLRLLTIILFSNRQKEAIAALGYYKSLGSAIIIPAPTQQFYKSIILSSLVDDSVIALRPRSDVDDLYQRLSNCQPWIKTPYFVVASDDDMLIHQGLMTALEHLERNKTDVSYYGFTVKALFKAPFLPIISPCYGPNNRQHQILPEPIDVFLRYRCYPLIYGVSRKSVLDAYLRLFPPDIGRWMGIWEFNYSIAVSLQGQACFDDKTPFLLRLVHQPSRSSQDDYPEAPRASEGLEEYLNRYVDVKEIGRLMCAAGDGQFLEDYLKAIYKDVLSDAYLMRSDLVAPVVRFSFFPSLLRSIYLNLRCLLSSPAYVFNYLALLSAAMKYYHDRTKSGIKLVV